MLARDSCQSSAGGRELARDSCQPSAGGRESARDSCQPSAGGRELFLIVIAASLALLAARYFCYPATVSRLFGRVFS